MAIIGALFAALGRAFSRIANMALGWATVLLFGHVPDSKRLLLTLVTLGSIGWVVALLGILFPQVGAILLAAIPVPEFIAETWVRIAMIVLAIALPPVIGIGTTFLIDKSERPKGAALLKQVLRGYPYAAVLAITLVFLALIALFRKATALVRRWEDASVPFLVKPGAYDEVVDDLERALDDADLEMARTKAPVVLTIPPRLLGAVGGAGVKGLVPHELALLKRDDLQVLVYPSDVSLLGAKQSLARGRAAIAARLTFTDAYLTAAEESQRIEDQLAELSKSPRTRPEDFRAIDRRLATLVVPFEEWDTLYRLRLQVENDARARRDGERTSEPGTGAARTFGRPGGGGWRQGPASGSAPEPVGWLLAGGAMALSALDIAMVWLERRARRARIRRS